MNLERIINKIKYQDSKIRCLALEFCDLKDVVNTGGGSGGGGAETDPVFSGSPAFGITNQNKTNWNLAFGWSNHALAGYLTSVPAQSYASLTGKPTALSQFTNDSNFVSSNTFATVQQTEEATNKVFYGDSLTFGYGGASYPSQYSTLSGDNVINRGVSGETSTQVKARLVAATDLNLPVIIWVGRNDFSITGASASALIKSNIADMVAALGHTKYLIVGVTNRSDEPTGNAVLNAINTLNSDLATLYGIRFVDIKAYLLTQGTGAGQDATDVSNGVIPSSLRFDTTHFNSFGYGKIANYIYSNYSSVLLGSNLNKIVTLNTLSEALANGKYQFDIAIGGSIRMGGIIILSLPNQETFTGSLLLSNGGRLLSHTTGTEGYNNTFLGIDTGVANTTGYNNTFVGRFAGTANTTGIDNTILGNGSGVANLTGTRNTYWGSLSGVNATGGSNIFGGFQSGLAVVAGDNNTMVGTQAGGGTNASGTINRNTFYGYRAGFLIANGGNNNIFIGYQAGDTVTFGSKNLIIAHDGDVPTVGGSNQLNIGNLLWGTGLTGTGLTAAGLLSVGGAVASTETFQVVGSGRLTGYLGLASTSTGLLAYNTVDEITNYERIGVSWVSNIASIGTYFGGTGTSRDLRLGVASAAGGALSRYIHISASTSFIRTTVAATTSPGNFFDIRGNASGSANTQSFLTVVSNVNQTSTASYNAIYTSIFEQATGSGTKFLLNLGTNSAADGGGTHTSKFSVSNTGRIFTADAPTFADNTTALAGGLIIGNIYKTVAGQLMIVI